MSFHSNTRIVGNEDCPPIPIGLPVLAKMAFEGRELAPVWNQLVHRVTDAPNDAAALLDLSTIAHLQGRREDRLALQSEALKLQQVYRQLPAVSSTKPIRLLAFMAPGDFMANMPIEFLLEGTGVRLDMLYIAPGAALPQGVPDHDVAMVAVAESDANQPVLREIVELVRGWPRPVLNAPDRIARLTRDGTWELLRSTPGVVIPMNARLSRADFLRLGLGKTAIDDLLPGCAFPIIARPSGSHAGEGLSKIDDRTAVAAYLQERIEQDFYIAPFIDYRNDDGKYRKYRVVLIEGRPYASHMATSSAWMIHYLNAGMTGSPEKRAEEAQFMANFDRHFAVRHSVALRAIAERFGLDYIPFDCGETQDGRLLVFESGTNMIVHSMDSPELFPYKRPQMEKLFHAFEVMLQNACALQIDGPRPHKSDPPPIE